MIPVRSKEPASNNVAMAFPISWWEKSQVSGLERDSFFDFDRNSPLFCSEGVLYNGWLTRCETRIFLLSALSELSGGWSEDNGKGSSNGGSLSPRTAPLARMRSASRSGRDSILIIRWKKPKLCQEPYLKIDLVDSEGNYQLMFAH